MIVAFINPDLFDLKIYFYTDGEKGITPIFPSLY